MQKNTTRYAGTPTIIKRVNRDSIIEIIQNNPGITIPAIAAKIGLSVTTVNKLVKELNETNYILEGDCHEPGVGRPARVYRVNENRKHCLILYLTKEWYYCFVSNLNCDIEIEKKVAHKEGTSYVEELCTIIQTMIDHEKGKDMGCIGIAVPGTVTDSIVVNIPHIEELEGMDLQACVEKRFGLPVVVENCIKIATIGIYKRVKEEKPGLLDLVFLYMDEGVSQGSMINGRLYISKNNFAGEIGYLRGIVHCEDMDFETAYLQFAQAGDKEKIREMTVHLVHLLCCVLDPELIAIACPELQEKDVVKIKEDLRKKISLKSPPDIILEDIDIRRYVYGLTIMCIDKIQKSVNLTEVSI